MATLHAIRKIAPSGDGHIVITGTGRAGTTALVQYMTALGFDTGYTVAAAVERSEKHRLSRGALERRLRDRGLPHVVKGPGMALELDQVLLDGSPKIEAVILPIRPLRDSAESRRRVFREAASRGLDAARYPGSLWGVSDPKQQESFLAIVFYDLVETLTRHRVPTYMLSFPRFVRSHNDLYEGLRGLLARYDVSAEQSEEAFNRVIRSDYVHNFSV